MVTGGRLASWVACFLLACPARADAYLDPGTGNILVYFVVSLLGALLFSVRGVFWAILGKKRKGLQQADYQSIAIFCEGRSYWNTFRPIVHALIDKGQPFSYYSMDIHDPGLTVENDLMYQRYIGEGSGAFARMGQVRCRVLLATTPNIGTKGFPMPRPPHAQWLVHVCHGVDDIGLYKKGSLDHYDAVMMVGPFMIHGIRHLERLRGLREKELLSAGLPYLDDLASKMKNPLPPTDGNTILVAPSWGTKGCLYVYGSAFIRQLAERGFRIVLRPHPHSWRVERDLLDRVKRDTKNYANVIWDMGADGAEAMEQADLLISDTSNIRMDFALLYERPVITLEIELSDPETFEISDMEEAWMKKAEREIGVVVDKAGVSRIAEIAAEVLRDYKPRQLTDFRDENVHNFGSSGNVIADYVIDKINADERPVGSDKGDLHV